MFFRTESGIRAHRSRTRVELRAPDTDLHVVVDSGERYPWRFPGATVERRKLASGDYALMDGARVLAVVERKSFDNLLSDIGAIQALHQTLADLASHAAAALVIEAQYADFLDARRVAGRWPPAHLARVLAEITALHPTLPVVFAGNRKLANLWTERFFHAVRAGRGGVAREVGQRLVQGLDGADVAQDVVEALPFHHRRDPRAVHQRVVPHRQLPALHRGAREPPGIALRAVHHHVQLGVRRPQLDPRPRPVRANA
ncbi:MAG TPA: ERCC4 domain-containing protein, partial [Gemmatimonadales bacterium]